MAILIRTKIALRGIAPFAVGAAVLLAAIDSAAGPEPQPQTPPSSREAAPIDLTGYWVSVATEDWRWRMSTPRKGDYEGVPLNEEGRRMADTWDPDRDEANGDQCKAYGAGAIMRMPGRVHITWEDDSTLRIDTDAGQQTRFLHFGDVLPPSEQTRQGHSVASWEYANVLPVIIVGGRPPRGGVPRGGSLSVVTNHIRAGYLRTNGVPYSDSAVVTEHFDRHTDFGTEWFTVTVIVEDPQYLAEPFIVSSHFKREPDGSKWSPMPCEVGRPAP